jgi:hypothetical protein
MNVFNKNINSNHQSMKTKGLLFITAVVMLIFTSQNSYSANISPDSKPKWVQFISDEEKVKIKFPGEPEIIEEELEVGKHIRAKLAFEDQTMFMLDVVHHNNELSGLEDLDQVSLDSFNESIGGNIVSKDDFYVKKNKGIKATVLLEEQGMTIYYRVILVGQRQIQVVMMTPDALKDEKTSQKFFKSFKILK